MKTVSVIFTLVLIFVAAANLAANPNSPVKSSPLFKASLNQSIDKLEGKVESQLIASKDNSVLATVTGGGCVHPNLPWTMVSTCTPSVCGGSTCYSTCSASCYGTCSGATCTSTCQSTCQNTCANTCVGGSCQTYRFAGTSYWVYGSSYGNNWSQSPMPCYQNNPGGVFCQFDDEGSHTGISSVNYYNGAYSGSRTRTTTSSGASIVHAVILWYPSGIYEVDGGLYWYGPVSTSGVNSANIAVYE